MSGDRRFPPGRWWLRILSGGVPRSGEGEGDDGGEGPLPGFRRSLRASAVMAVLVGASVWVLFGSATYTLAELERTRSRVGLLGSLGSGREAGRGDSARPSGVEIDPQVERAILERERRRLQAALGAHRPWGAYIVVDRGNNRIFLRKGDSLLLEGVISTGSGAILQETTGQKRQWVFDTPSGRFTILAERSDPVWTKPDWAFLEEGKPIPIRLSERREYGSLGEYALDLGDGYMIHGTLYERLLGRSVTHGCVRVGREDLRTLVRHTGPGSQVFIY